MSSVANTAAEAASAATSPPSTIATASTGETARGRQGRGRRNRGGRGDGNRGRGRNSPSGNTNAKGRGRNPSNSSFKGNTDGMKGNVFQCHGETPDKQQFTKTLGVLEEHINKTFSYPKDVASICKTFAMTPPEQPKNLEKKVYEEDMGAKLMWETKMKTYMKRLESVEANSRAIYAIVWGQSSPLMQSKLESLEEFPTKSAACDCVWLLKEIRGITHKFLGDEKRLHLNR